jgi:S1-C subfamily serine protease
MKKALLATGAAASVLMVAACGGGGNSAQKTIAKATPSVVRIEGDNAGGSGFVIDAQKGLIVTNAHVVADNPGMKAQIGNDPSTTTPVRLVASDPCNDLAVLKLTTPLAGLHALPIGPSGKLRAGDPVTVLGFPGSLQSGNPNDDTTSQSATVVSNAGVVSSNHVKAGPFDDYPTLRDTIQHQAPVNHGNSGGPLINAKGQVVGINTLGSEGTQGQYYSISMDYAQRILPQLEAGHSASYMGWDLQPIDGAQDQSDLTQQLVGIFQASGHSSSAEELAADAADYLHTNPPTTGLYDAGDDPGSAADTSTGGGNEGYMITEINNVPVATVQDVCNIVQSASPGQKLSLTEVNISSGQTNTFSAERWIADNPHRVWHDTVTVPKS